MPNPAETALPPAVPASVPWWRGARYNRPLLLDGLHTVDTRMFGGLSGSSAGAMNAVLLAHAG